MIAWALLLVLISAAGCTPRPVTATPGARPDRTVTLPSGATLKVAGDWSVMGHDDGVTLGDPERQVTIELVEIADGADLRDAIARAWTRRRPGFDRAVLAASDSAAREGWDQFRWTTYRTSPAEQRRVSAYAARKGTLAVVGLVDGGQAAVQRRSSQMALVSDSLRPAGYVRESWARRTPRRLDAERVAELRRFIEAMREVADVPGASVALFDRDTMLIEEGFGVRERGRPEPVTADTLYMIASNTKPLTTLMLARLVDEGRFGWDTPVTRVYPDFRIGDADVTRRILMRHLVCACTGLPRRDLEWLFTFHRSSPQAQLDLLARMRPTTDFGALYQYSNPLAAAAGYVGARAVVPGGELGAAYDTVMRDLVFRPLGMTRTTFSFEDALRTDHASPHSWDLSLRSVPGDMALNRSIVPVRPTGGAWSSVRDYARYVRLELAGGRLPDGTTLVTEATLLARRAPQIRTGAFSWYGMGLFLEDIRGVRVISHGGSMFGYKSNFFVVPAAGVGGVVLTNADSGWNLARAVMRRTLEVIYDGRPEAEAQLRSAVEGSLAFQTGAQRDWIVPPNPAEVRRLARAYRSAALGEIRVRAANGEVVFEFDGWKSRMATKPNPDGTTSFVSIDPGIRGFEFNAPAAAGDVYPRLTLRDAQHAYDYEAAAGGG
jgi:CubicO group peptidase (beta-lactamase class C family)